MCDCDDNPQLCGGSVPRKARKPHRCCECWRVIGKGEAYLEYSGLWRDGGWQSYRWCAHCEAGKDVVWALTRARTPYFCWCFEQLWEGIKDDWDGTGQVAVYRLIVAARRKWTYRRGPRMGQLVPVPSAPILART